MSPDGIFRRCAGYVARRANPQSLTGTLPVQQRPWPEQAFQFGFFFFGYYGFVGVFSPYVSLYFSDAGMTAVQIGVLMSLIQVTRIFGPNLWGWISDRLQRRVLVLRLTAAGAVASFVGMFFGETFAQFFIVMVLLNIFTSAQGPMSEALMLTEMKGDLTHYGLLRLWGSVGYIVAVMAAGLLLDWRGIGLFPWVGLVLLGLVLFASIRLKEAPQTQARQKGPSVLALLQRREIIAFLMSACLMIAAHTSMYVFFSLYMEQLGYSKMMIGLMWALSVVAEIAFFFYQAPIFRRFGVQRLMLFSLGIAVVRFLMVGFGSESLLLLMIAQVLHAATFAAHHSSMIMSLQRWFSGPLQARGQALYISVSYGLGGTLGGIGFSYIWDHFGPEAMYVVAAVVALGGLFAALLSFRWRTASETS